MKKLNKILSIISVAVLTLPILTFTWHKSKGAANENEVKFPSFTNTFSKDFFNYVENHFPYRPEIIESNKKVDNKLLEGYKKINSYFEKRKYGPDYLSPVVVNNALYGRDDWLFYTGDKSVEAYQGLDNPTDEYIQLEYTVFKQLHDVCKSKGINLIYNICPNKEQIYPEYMPSIKVYNEYKKCEILRDFFNKTEINYYYMIDELLEAKKDGLVYFKQDTHWNYRGAFIGYKNLMESLGREVEDPQINEITKTGGDLSIMCGFSSTYQDWEVVYKPGVTYKLDRDGSEIEHSYENASGVGRVCVIGDSFKGYNREYFYKDFEETFVCHRNQIEKEPTIEFVKSLTSGDTLILQSVERYEGEHIEISKKLLTYLS